MSVNNPFSLLRYTVSIVIAMCLDIGSWPQPLLQLNPDWILLVLIYWTLAVPERTGILNSWVVGLLTDVLTGRMLGQHALSYSLVTYMCLKLHKRLRQYPLMQQGLFIFFCLLSSQLIIFWTENAQISTRFQTQFWLPTITGTLCWPLVYSVMRTLRHFRRFR